MPTTGPTRVQNGLPLCTLAAGLAWAFVAGPQAGAAGTFAGQSAQRTPNVLLITVCSVRPDHMSCYGYRRDTTPHLTAFARQAIVFDSAFTQWPKTSPGFAAIATAKYGHANGVMHTLMTGT